MLEIASQITMCLFIAAIIGGVIGYLLGKMSCKNTMNETIIKEEELSNKPTVIEEVQTLTPTISNDINEEDILIPTSPAIEEVALVLEEIETEETSVKPTLLDAPREGKKDHLSTIKGIGPKVEEQLNAAGIFHFEQIAHWTEENIQWLEKHTTFAHRAKKDLWVNQAKSLI